MTILVTLENESHPLIFNGINDRDQSVEHLQIQFKISSPNSNFPPYRHMDQKYEVSRIRIEAQQQRNGKGVKELTGRTSRTGSTKSPDN